MFLKDTIPWWLAPAGYGGLAVVSTIFIPMIYTPVKWYYVLVAYIIAPLFALPVSQAWGAAQGQHSLCNMAPLQVTERRCLSWCEPCAGWGV